MPCTDHWRQGNRRVGQRNSLRCSRINEPTGDSIGVVTFHLAGVWMKNVNTINFDLQIVVSCFKNINVRLTEDDKEIPLPVFFRSSAMCRSAFMRALSTGMRPSLAIPRNVRRS